MSADGNWSITMSTPLGERQSSLAVKTDGGVLTGSQTADGNSTPIFDGSVTGNNVAWKVSITEPMPMTLEFSGAINGDEISGNVTLGPFGTSSFSGRRS
jgi:hypothetical protein